MILMVNPLSNFYYTHSYKNAIRCEGQVCFKIIRGEGQIKTRLQRIANQIFKAYLNVLLIKHYFTT